MHSRKIEPKDAWANSFLYVNSTQQDASSEIRGGGNWTEERAGESEEKVAICVIYEQSERPPPMSSEERVALGVQNSARTVEANLGSDESSNVDNDEQFAIPLAEVGYLAKLTYKVRLGIGLTKDGAASKKVSCGARGKIKF